MDLWIRLADGALLVASGNKISSNTVLDSIAGEIGIGLNCNSLYAVLPFLLSTIETFAHEASSPPQLPYVLLKLTSDVLVASYPPADAGVKKMLCDILCGLTEFTKTVCADFLVEYFTLVQEGVRLWIEDKMNMLTDPEFNQQVREALKIPVSLSFLFQGYPFLCSFSADAQSNSAIYANTRYTFSSLLVSL